MKTFLYKKLYPVWKSKYATFLKKRRLRFVNECLRGQLDSNQIRNKKILEIGCQQGIDFIQFFLKKSRNRDYWS